MKRKSSPTKSSPTKGSPTQGSSTQGSSTQGSSTKGSRNETPPVKVSIWVDELPHARRGGLLLAVAGVGAIALLGWGGWLAVNLIVNPRSVSWLNNILPEWGQFVLPGSMTQTLAEIATEEARLGRTLGEPIAVASPNAAKDLLLPILELQSRCQGNSKAADPDCQKIVELRVYRPGSNSDSKYELVDRLKVAGIEELMAIAPLRQVGGSSRKLPLTHAALIEGKPPDASVWLNLGGELQRGNAEVKYGQVVRYDPQRDRLQVLLPWTSPVGQMPRWQQVTGTDRSANELVVNQAVGLEPQFQVYQVSLPHASKPLRLEAIALMEIVSSQPRYRQGLLLARNGLWSPALKLLDNQAEKGENSDSRAVQSQAIQAQIDFIRLHAQVTQAQADRTWASPTQQIAALVIDGRWTKALEALRSAHVNGYDTKSLLSANAESLQRRVEAVLRVDPNQPVVRQWGAMTVASQRDRSAAVVWLRQHPLHPGKSAVAERSPRFIQQMLALLDPLPVLSASQPQISSAQPEPLSLPMIGAVSPLTTLQVSDWYSPRPLVLPKRQVWYQIEVLGFQQGQQWQRSPFTLPPSTLPNSGNSAAWNHLGLTPDAQIQIVGGSGASSQSVAQTVSVKAIQWRGGKLRLLAAADLISPDPILAIAVTLPWLTPIDSLTLTSLSQQQPQQTATLVTALKQQLQQAGQMPSADPSPIQASAMQASAMQASTKEEPSADAQALAQVGDWQIDRLELTGEGQPESVLTIKTETNPDNASAPIATARTIIFSSTGSLLYSDLALPEQTIAAIVDVPYSTPALVIHKDQLYQIQQWSQSRQRFE
jgi:hypothetical protein